MAFLAKFNGTCNRCKGPIVAGQDMIAIYNRPHKGATFHAVCPGGLPKGDAPEGNEEPEPTETPKRTPPAPGSIDALIDARIDSRLEGFEPSAALDEDAVKAIVANLTAREVKIEITLPDGATTKIEGAHYLAPRVLKLAAAGFPIYLWGTAGSGKTTLGLQVAEGLKRSSEIDTLTRDTSRTMVQGFRSPSGDHMETPFTRTYAVGGAYIPDELDAAPAAVQGMFNSALANGHAPAAWGPMERHPLWIFIGTGNTPLCPTRNYPDRQPGNEAFKDRLYFIEVPVDRNIMRRKCGLPANWNPPERKERTCTPAAWGTWVERMMDWTWSECPTIKVTPRAAIEGVRALALGETPEEVAHGLVFRGADAALVSKALAACPLP